MTEHETPRGVTKTRITPTPQSPAERTPVRRSRAYRGDIIPGAGYEGPTNAELMQEIKWNRRLLILLLILVLLLLAGLLGMGFYVYRTFQSYEAQLQEAFETMQKLDDVVEKLQKAYTAYSGQIEDFFDTVTELKGYVDTFKGLLGSLPKIQLPF